MTAQARLSPLRPGRLRGALLAGALVLSACSQPSEPAAPTAAPAAEAPSRGHLPERLAACAPPSETPWVETGRARDGEAEYVFLERQQRASAEFDPAILRLSGATCAGYVVYETDGGSDAAVQPPSDRAWDELLDESFAWHVAQSGGVEAYADLQRAYTGSAELAECPPDDDLGPCLQTWLAQRFRRAGVEVGTSAF